ncbi:MAG: cobyrinate a,c-diamide synthase, partial [Candidatus Binatia bacterium]
AGTASGVGKTTVMVGLARALRTRGLRVAVFKCGPDYLDPTFHARAAGRASQNLDGWMMGRDAVHATFVRTARDADIALVEGMMGLFDGASPTDETGSAAEIAKWLGAPVLLVVDASAIARTIAAVAHGFATFDPGLDVAGVIANRVGGRAHLDLLREALARPPIVGGLPDDPSLRFPERHLGLVRADDASVPETLLAAWGARAAEWLDLQAILDLARSAPPLAAESAVRVVAPAPRCRIALADDEAFHFYYEDNLRRLETLGAEIVRFSPIHDAGLPDVDGLYVGGGYPEAHAEALARNASMLESVSALAAADRPIYAECGGLMYLARAIRTLDGRRHPMAGLFELEIEMRNRLQAIGYVEVETRAPSWLGGAGLRFRGHEFRHSEIAGEADDVERLYSVSPRSGGEPFAEGFRRGSVIASYVHAHWASSPRIPEGFIAAARVAGRR